MQIRLLGSREIEGAPDSDAYIDRLARLRDDDWALFVALALSYNKYVDYRELLQTIWPERRYDKLLKGEDAEDHAVELSGEHQLEAITDGLEQLRNCVSRLRKYLEAAGAPNDCIARQRAKPQQPTSGAYRLNLRDSLQVDLVQFATLLAEGKDESRVTALGLFSGPLLEDSSSSQGIRQLRSRLRGRVSTVVEVLLPGVAEAKVATYVEDIVVHGDCLRIRAHLARLRLPGDYAFTSGEPVDDLPLGLESSAVSEVAQTTFRDLVTAWINSPADSAAPATVEIPVNHVVATTLPAQWGDVDSIRLNFLVFAADPGSPETDLETGEMCFRYRLTEREVKTLREYVDTGPRAYFVLAVPKRDRSTTAELLYLAPIERFDFYTVDLVQYYRAHQQDDLLIPVQNKLNLALFSLIWAARWVEDFFAPLWMPTVVGRKPLRETIDLVFNTKPDLDAIRLRGWDSLVRNLPDAREYIDGELYRRASFRIGMGSAMQLINEQMTSAVARGRLTAVRTYCPEALYGTANLWLFSRTYHQFMDTTADFQKGRPEFVNQRLLPAAQDLKEGSLLYAATLWHVVMLYRLRRARVSIVAMPREGGHEDHGFYEGKGIGDFMWIALDERTGAWVQDQAKASVQSDHEEYINEHERNVLAGPELSDTDYAGQCGMVIDDLTLHPRAPSLLFPSNDAFLETPLQLWSPLAQSARAKGL